MAASLSLETLARTCLAERFITHEVQPLDAGAQIRPIIGFASFKKYFESYDRWYSLKEALSTSLKETLSLKEDRSFKEDLSLKELVKLPVAAQWYQLGIQLGIPKDQLDQIQVNYPREVSMCLPQMFDWWLKNGACPTRRQLAEALQAIDRRDLAKKFSKRVFPEGEKKSGFRKLWGAMKSYTTKLIEGFLEGLGSLAADLGIRRRYKKYNGVERWWFELVAEENDLQALERSKEWKKLQASTGWRLGGCFMPLT